MMKVICATLFLAISFSISSQGQSVIEAPYKRFPTIPPVKLLLTDSSTFFTKEDLSKKKATMIMLFSPDCDHCQHETEEIIKHIDAFEKIQILMATIAPFDKMFDFFNKYDLKRFDNIVMGKDVNNLLPSFYDIRNFPFLAFYNKKKELISVFEGSMLIQKIMEELRK